MSKYEDPFEAFRKKREGAAQEKKAEEADSQLDRFRVPLANPSMVSHRYVKVETAPEAPPSGFEATRLADPSAPSAQAGPPPPGMERILKQRAEGEPVGPMPEGFESGRHRAAPVEKPEKPAGFESGRFDR